MPETFTPENFKKAFKPYLIKWGIAYAILMGPITTIIVPCIFFPNWQFSQQFISLFMDIGARFDATMISYGGFVIGIIHLPGIIAIGVNGIGGLAVGLNACGIVAIGLNACGVIAIGGNAIGVVTIGGGYGVFGVYVLSYLKSGKGKYVFAPHRQDPKAVAFFTRWLPKLTEFGIQGNNT